jgi:hypothetical protein
MNSHFYRGLFLTQHRPITRRTQCHLRPFPISHNSQRLGRITTWRHVQTLAALRSIVIDDAEANRKFPEEPLHLSAENGGGYLFPAFGDRIGPGERYGIVRKLGWGTESNVWMAFDEVYVFFRYSKFYPLLRSVFFWLWFTFFN